MTENQDKHDTVLPAEPAFPKTVLVAGIIWIVLGGWVFLIAGCMMAMERHDSPMSISAWGLVSGAVSIYIGIQTVRGKARGMNANGLASIVFGLFIVIHTTSVVVALPHQRDFGLVAGLVDAVGTAFVALGFLAAGLFAFRGRHEYEIWLQAKITTRGKHEAK
jgi:hypothetical protein